MFLIVFNFAPSAVLGAGLLRNSRQDGGMSFRSLECIITQTISEGIMKTFLNIIGIVLILAGGTFFLQGINVLPGSYMTGDPQWAINGGILIVIGIGLLIWARRKNKGV
jgi:hypothetical protein